MYSNIGLCLFSWISLEMRVICALLAVFAIAAVAAKPHHHHRHHKLVE